MARVVVNRPPIRVGAGTLLHAVSSGKGFRMSIVLCNHKPVVEGYDYFDREVWVAEEVGGEEYQEWV